MTDVHVALVTPWRREGGIATYSSKLFEALEDAGVDCTIVTIENPDSANPVAFGNLVDQIPETADVVHVQFEAALFGRLGMTGIGAPAFFYALGRLDIPVVTTLHEVHREHPHRGKVGDRLLRWRDYLIEHYAIRVSDAIIVHTRNAQEIIRKRHGDARRIERMLHPADETATPIPQEEAKEELDIDGSMVLSFGFVEKKKRYQDVIRALPELPEVTYVIAGGYRDEEGRQHANQCLKLAADLGMKDRIQFTGYVDDEDIPVVFSAADAVVLPYERVSQSGVVNDALSYHRPVVTSSLPAFEEIKSEYDCLLTYQDQSDIRAKLHLVMSDDETIERLTSGTKTYVQSVTWKQFGLDTAELYSMLVHES